MHSLLGWLERAAQALPCSVPLARLALAVAGGAGSVALEPAHAARLQAAMSQTRTFLSKPLAAKLAALAAGVAP